MRVVGELRDPGTVGACPVHTDRPVSGRLSGVKRVWLVHLVIATLREYDTRSPRYGP